MSEVNTMDKVIDNLWIGNMMAALDADLLHKNGIKSIMSCMRGKITIEKAFARYQVQLDDTDETDALVHFPACIEWIDSEIKKGRGVLVHCQAGMSRSAVIVAAYLMYTQRIDVDSALSLIRKARPSIQPNDGFIVQLTLFHAANYKRSRRNKDTRAFYVERAIKEVLNGDGSPPEMDMFAKYPRSPGDSVPNTPYPQPRRRIRCKMCRQELATREHMIDHGQVGPATPATGDILSRAPSRRPSQSETVVISSRSSESGDRTTVSLARRVSNPSSGTVTRRPSFGASISAMTPIHALEPVSTGEITISEAERTENPDAPKRRRSLGMKPFGGLSMTPLETLKPSSDSTTTPSTSAEDPSVQPPSSEIKDDKATASRTEDNNMSISSALETDEEEDAESLEDESASGQKKEAPVRPRLTMSVSGSVPSPLSTPQALAAQIHPALAALRTSPLISALSSGGSLGMTPLNESASSGSKSAINAASPPLLLPNAKCSGYFVEPMRWMGFFLESGNMAGKIMCPNKKCGAKLGSYDWAGIECSCKEWVVPGFCIHRSKVDEVVI